MNTKSDFKPTITPVIDLSAVKQGMSEVFGKEQGINVSRITAKVSEFAANGQNGSTNSSTGAISSQSMIDQSKVEIINNFQVRNDSDVRKISEQQRTLVDKYMRTKGVPVG